MKKGFTLIELLVVVLIIGILAAIALPQYQFAVWKARVSEMQMLAKRYHDAEEIFFFTNGRYITDPEELDVDIPPGAVLAADNLTIGRFNIHLRAGGQVVVRPSGGIGVYMEIVKEKTGLFCRVRISDADQNKFCAKISDGTPSSVRVTGWNDYRI